MALEELEELEELELLEFIERARVVTSDAVAVTTRAGSSRAGRVDDDERARQRTHGMCCSSSMDEMAHVDLPDIPGCFPADSLFPGPYAAPASVPLGGWRAIANGRVYTLDITALAGADVTATLSSGTIRDARWDAATKRFTFTRVIPNVIEQAWSAYVMHYDAGDPFWRMAGTFQTVKNLSPHNVPMIPGGWYATLRR